MIQYIKEITKWVYPNHTYIVESDKALGYIPEGETTPIWFRKPMRFSKTGRKFKKVSGLKLLRG